MVRGSDRTAAPGYSPGLRPLRPPQTEWMTRHGLPAFERVIDVVFGLAQQQPSQLGPSLRRVRHASRRRARVAIRSRVVAWPTPALARRGQAPQAGSLATSAPPSMPDDGRGDRSGVFTARLDAARALRR